MKNVRVREKYRLPDLTQIFKDKVEVRGDDLKISYAQNVGDIYRMNAEMRKNSDENWAKSKEFKHAAAIPLLEYEKLARLGITDDPKALYRAIEAHPEWKVTTKRLI